MVGEALGEFRFYKNPLQEIWPAVWLTDCGCISSMKGNFTGLLMLPHLPAALLFLFWWAVTRCKCDLDCVHRICITSLLINARDKEVPSLQPAHDVLQHCLLWHFPNATTTWVWSWDYFLCIILNSDESHTCPYPCEALLFCLHAKSWICFCQVRGTHTGISNSDGIGVLWDLL